MPLSCNFRQACLSWNELLALRRAPARVSSLPGPNLKPVVAPPAMSASSASITVSARPPTRDTIGTGAVSQGTKLGQAAGFEARRHDEGIRTGLNKMGEGLVIANMNCYSAHIRFRDLLVAILEIRISTAKQSKLHSFAYDGGNVFKKEIQSLLPGQPTYNTEQERIRS